MRKNILHSIDLQLNLLSDGFIEPNKDYRGLMRLTTSDSDDDLCDGELTFVETSLIGSVRRNVCRYNGEHITATQRPDGSPRLNFRTLKLNGDFNIERFAFEVANEIRRALKFFLVE